MDFPAITKERIEACLDSMELTHQRDEDDDVSLAFNNAYFAFTVREGLMVGHGFWAGTVQDQADRTSMYSLINDFNSRLAVGCVIPLSNEENMKPKVEFPFLLDEGVTDEQLGIMIDVFLTVSFGVFGEFEEQYPHLITWESE